VWGKRKIKQGLKGSTKASGEIHHATFEAL
jgi:hypothetical protein